MTSRRQPSPQPLSQSEIRKVHHSHNLRRPYYIHTDAVDQVKFFQIPHYREHLPKRYLLQKEADVAAAFITDQSHDQKDPRSDSRINHLPRIKNVARQNEQRSSFAEKYASIIQKAKLKMPVCFYENTPESLSISSSPQTQFNLKFSAVHQSPKLPAITNLKPIQKQQRSRSVAEAYSQSALDLSVQQQDPSLKLKSPFIDNAIAILEEQDNSTSNFKNDSLLQLIQVKGNSSHYGESYFNSSNLAQSTPKEHNLSYQHPQTSFNSSTFTTQQYPDLQQFHLQIDKGFGDHIISQYHKRQMQNRTLQTTKNAEQIDQSLNE